MLHRYSWDRKNNGTRYSESALYLIRWEVPQAFSGSETAYEVMLDGLRHDGSFLEVLAELFLRLRAQVDYYSHPEARSWDHHSARLSPMRLCPSLAPWTLPFVRPDAFYGACTRV